MRDMAPDICYSPLTSSGQALIKKAKRIEDAMSFVTDRIRRPGPPQTLLVPPTRRKKVDENGNILKPLAGHRGGDEIFGKNLFGR